VGPGRNDVGRVAEWGSVKVDELMAVERYSHVMHIVSNVVGRLRAGFALDVPAAFLPGRWRRSQGAGHADHRGA
jgi:anthranilate/para-aminobenzoate synthase component I